VDESLTVPSIAPAIFGFSDMPPGFATAFLVAFVEWACIQLLNLTCRQGNAPSAFMST
jgi:fluoroacetyl-CoA thioesterase